MSVCLLGSGLAGFVFRSGPVSSPPGADSDGSAPASPMPIARAPGDPAPNRIPDETSHIKSTGAKQRVAASEFPETGNWDEIRDWVRSHPTEALAWAASAPPGQLRDSVAELICSLLAASDPAQAAAVAEGLGGNGTTNVLENVALQWAERDEPAAYAWAAGKPPGEERDRLLSRIAFEQSKSNPEAAANLVAEQISPGDIQDEAAISVACQWAAQDVNAAMAWAQLFPDGRLRARVILEVERATGTAAE